MSKSWPDKVFSFLGLGQYKASPVAAADGEAVPLLVEDRKSVV